MTDWPILRTRPVSGHQMLLAVWAKATVGMVVISLLLGALAFLLATLLTVFGLWSYPVNSKLEGFGLMFVLSPILTVPTAICATPLAALGLAHGYAGWGISIVCGALAGVVCLWVLDGFMWDPVMLNMGLFFGTIFGALMWISGKLFYPDVLTVRTSIVAS